MKRKFMLAKQRIERTIVIFGICLLVSNYGTQTREATKPKSQKKHVIIWTDARTGSTFLADLLSRIKSTYYISEPINTLVGLFPNSSLGKIGKLTEFLKRIILCEFSKPKWYWEKYRRERQYENVPLRDLYRDKSLDPLWSTSSSEEMICKASDVVLTKQIVVPIKQSLLILKDTSLNPYILHLVRDPRSVLSSRQNMEERGVKIHPNLLNTTLMCKNMKENLHQVEIIKEQFPKRYFLVRYEDLTRDTEVTILK
ncbi:unnamed protein product, partial [Meganyctiphanes norvegica]